MFNIKLTLAYDGANYLGWQKTNMGPSVEETLEKVLERLLQHPVKLQAASRTDAGVHANGQIVNFFTPKTLLLDKLQYGLNGLLPTDIAIKSIELVSNDFHPTLACKNKEYHYHACYGRIQLPNERYYSWHYPCKLNIDTMRTAITYLVGNRDFSAFCNAKNISPYPHYTRYLESIEVHELENECLRFEVCGNNFLYKMVRNIVGTLVHVGCGKINLETLPSILEDGNRTKAGMTAPALGLFLHKVNY